MDKTSPREVLLSYGKWIGSSDFAKLIAEKRNISERQAKTDISKARREKQIVRHVFSDRTVIYGLQEFGPPTSEASHQGISEPEVEKVRKALEELRGEFRFFKEPTVKQVACRAGMRPDIVESILYELAPQTGWAEPQENAEKEAEHAVNLAGWLLWKQKSENNSRLEELSAEAINNASPDTGRRAKNILKMYPDLVPVVDGTELRWPEETKRNWQQIFGCEPPPPQYWGAYVGFIPHHPRF
jgi:hypothetical protein